MKPETDPQLVCVPREPIEAQITSAAATPGMKEVESAVVVAAVHHCVLSWAERGEEAPIVQAYKAMLAAAPSAGTYVAVPRELLEVVAHALSEHADVTFGWEGEDENCGDLADELRSRLHPTQEDKGTR